MKRLTIGDRLANQRTERFVGRAAELRVFDQVLAGDLTYNVLFVHGPGGVGKTSLLRAMHRRARNTGRPTYWVDGRSLNPVPDALPAALRPALASGGDSPVVFIDNFERIEATGRVLREEILPALPDRTLVVIAGRRAPDPNWRRDGWDQVALELPLRELTHAEAVELLRAHGVHDLAAARRILAWTAGSPLALTLAAGAYTTWGEVGPRPDIVAALVGVVTESELDPSHHDALITCAVARRTTIELLTYVLPADQDPRAAYDWLASRSFVDAVGDALTLHDVVRVPVLEHVRARQPERERELRRRIADYLYARTLTGDRLGLIDLAHLAVSPVIRWGYCWDGSSRYHVDRVRPGDAEIIGRRLRERGYVEWWQASQAYFQHAPELVTIARDGTGRPVGYGVALTPASAPRMLGRDPFLVRWLEHAQRTNPEGQVVLWRDTIDLTRAVGEPEARVLGMLNLSVTLRSEVANPRYAYIVVFSERGAAFCQLVGGRRVPELEFTSGGRHVECYLIDYGPGGLYATQRNFVYRELGLPPPPPTFQPAAEDVRQALENYCVSTALSENPLARGLSLDERAAHVRRLLREAVGGAFGHSAREEQLRAIVTRRFFEPRESHEAIARALSISRATYFRRLQEAVDRVCRYVLANIS